MKESNLSLAIKAAEAASKEILNVYHSNDFQTEWKSDYSPLTIADKRAHEVIESILHVTGIPILSEEGKAIPYAVRKDWKQLWVVDPLDGTKEFIRRNGEFTVNIALIENQKPILGVVAVPVTNKIYYSSMEEGAFVNEGGQVSRLSMIQKKELDSLRLRVVASRSHANHETKEFVQSLQEPVLVSKGSSLKFMMLADGEADIYPRFAPTMEWDTAAAHAIVNQLGFKILRKDSSEELIYNKENLLNPSFICR